VHLILPLIAAAMFAVGSLVFKRAFIEGANTRQAFHISNIVLGAFYLPLLFVERARIPWSEIWQPAIVGLCLFVGGFASLAAIRRADVSLVTPLLGTKPLFVAAGTVLITALPVSIQLWAAAALTAAGIFVLGFRDMRIDRAGWAVASALVLASAASFAAADVLLQHWAVAFGGWAFLALFAVAVPFFTLAALPFERGPIFRLPACRLRWLALGSSIFAAQGVLMAIALGFFADATRVNIVYSSRGLWALLLVGPAAWWFGVPDGAVARGALRFRLAGTLMIIVAVVMAVWP
jgi:drug/metabolite transporter (DMT)-like permease